MKHIQTSGVSFEIYWDSRVYPQAPIEGAFHELSYTWYSPRSTQTQEILPPFQKMEFHLRHYFPLHLTSFSPYEVLSWEVFYSQLKGDEIPFQFLNSIGGKSFLRGYYEGSYRDKQVLFSQIDYHFDFKTHWSFSTFMGSGKINNDFDSLTNSTLLFSYGLGLHYLFDPLSRTKIRIDLGKSTDRVGFYFVVGEAF